MAARLFGTRYSLDVQINSSHNALLWRAIDRALDRVVCIVLLPHTDKRAKELLELANAAAVNSSRGAVSILDIVEHDFVKGVKSIDSETPYLGVVTEWVDGETIDHILGKKHEPFDVKEALKILTHVTRAVGAMHALGVIHGRLRPRNVYLNEAREVRVSGFGIDRALFQADGHSVQTDIAGIGDLLFAMTTATWPHGSVGALPAAELSENQTLTLPSQMRNRISKSVDELYAKTQNGTFQNTDELLQAITVANVDAGSDIKTAVQRWTDHEVVWHGQDIHKSHRLRYSALAFLGVYIFGWIGWQLMTTNFHSSNAQATVVESPSALTSPSTLIPSVSPSYSPLASASPSTSGSWFPVFAKPTSATGYDPYGDGSENPELAKLAIDGDVSTAWTTAKYYRADYGKKPGVGLLLDLGKSVSIKTVDVTFTTFGHSGTIFISDNPKPDINTATALGTVSNSDVTHKFIGTTPIQGRYVLLWLTKLPRLNNGSFVGGINEIQIEL